MTRKQFLLVSGAVFSFAVSAPAALVTLYSVKTSDTDFEVRASISTDDNYGLAAFQIELTEGTYTSITNYSPRVLFFKNGSEYSPSAGFTMLRSPNGVNPVNGAQATLDPVNSIMVYGIGQSPGSLSSKNPGGYEELMAVQATYDTNVILVKGTTAPGDPAPTLQIGYNPSAPMVVNQVYSQLQAGTFANVFTSPSGITTAAADVVLTDQPVPTPVPTTPTPTPEEEFPPCGSCPGVGLIVMACMLRGLFSLSHLETKSNVTL